MDKTMLQPAQTALLNIDMQHFFVEGSPDGLLVLERINRLAASCRRANMAVIHTMTPFRLQVAHVEHALALHHDLAIDPTDIIFVKYHFGAFHESELERILRDRGVDTLIISGIRTNVCCAATAWEAIARQFTIYFLRNGTATKEMGGVPHTILQQATCATFEHLFGNTLSVDEMITRIETSTPMKRDPSKKSVLQPIET